METTVKKLSTFLCQCVYTTNFKSFLVHLFCDNRCLLLVLKLEHFTLPLCVLFDMFHTFNCSTDHFVFSMFHYFKFDLFIGETSLKERLGTGDVDEDVFVECELIENERLVVVKMRRLLG